MADTLELYNLIKNYKLADENKVGMLGGSAGGRMVYKAVANVNWIKAAVSIAGPSDEETSLQDRGEDMKTTLTKYYDITSQLELDKRSAIKWVDKFSKTTPLLLLHGTSDWRVKVTHSINLAQKLYENKVPYRLIILEGADHSINEFKGEFVNQVKSWFDRYLKNSEQMPNLELHGR